ncbi:MAG: hypothetical protein MUQ30_16135 [Anaerolineae bacterium]|nr:hypothetical protein [Anaerolineae bacterium]
MATRTLCPACEEHVALGSGYGVNSKIRCPHCYSDLIVVQLDPVKLDWDDYDDDDDDDDDWDD